MKENEIEGIKKTKIKVVVLVFVMVYNFCSKVTKMKMWGRRSNCVWWLNLFQMGSTRKSKFDDQTSRALKQWHKNALKKKVSKGCHETQTLGRSFL